MKCRFRQALDTVIPWAEELLFRIMSVSSWTHNAQGVNLVQDQLQEVAENLGMSPERMPVSKRGDILVCNTGSVRRPRDFVLLVGHSDTVHPRECGLRREYDRWWGPGVLDMKAGLVMIFAALKVLDEIGGLHSIPIKVVINSSLEAATPESISSLIDNCVGASGVLVIEPGRKGDNVITRRAGILAYELHVKGTAAHVGNSFTRGVSAFSYLAHLVLRIDALTDLDRQIIANVGTIEGGTANNIIAPQSRASCEIRVPTSEEMEHVRSFMNSLTRTDIDGISVSIYETGWAPPLEQTPRSLALFNAYRAFAARAGLQYDLHQRVGGVSDANRLQGCGVPIIDGLGPFGEGAHTANEWVSISSFRAKLLNLVYYLNSLSIEAVKQRHAGAFSDNSTAD